VALQGFEIKIIRGVPAPFPLVAGGGIGSLLLRINLALIRLSKTLFSFQTFVVATSTPDVQFLVKTAVRNNI